MDEKINVSDIKHRLLARFVRTIKEDGVTYIRSIFIKNKEHKLYQIGNVLAITVDNNLIIEWDEEFDYIYNT